MQKFLLLFVFSIFFAVPAFAEARHTVYFPAVEAGGCRVQAYDIPYYIPAGYELRFRVEPLTGENLPGSFEVWNYERQIYVRRCNGSDGPYNAQTGILVVWTVKRQGGGDEDDDDPWWCPDWPDCPPPPPPTRAPTLRDVRKARKYGR